MDTNGVKGRKSMNKADKMPSMATSIGAAIDLLESVRRIMDGHIGINRMERMDFIIQEMKDMMKDVRYGGAWEGNSGEVLEILGKCKDMRCHECKNRIRPQCERAIKEDAQNAIRKLMEENRILKTDLATMSEKYDELFQKFVNKEKNELEPAEWQKKIMRGGGKPPETNEIETEKVEYDPMKEKE